MKKVYFITRADDAGSSKSANLAIVKAVGAGFIKNVSIMAPGAHLQQASDLLAGNKKICFGMHGTINAEWDKVKWKPVGDHPHSNALVDENGFFVPETASFKISKPDTELIMKEYEAQLDLLTRMKFSISYVDSHMFPEGDIPGMDEAVRDFAKRKGLLDHMYYYRLPPGLLKAIQNGENMLSALKKVPDGQYFYLAHPALYSEEMLQTGNRFIRGDEVAKTRSGEAKLLGTPGIALLMRVMGIRPLRYDEAGPLEKRLTAEDVKKILDGE